MQNKLEIDGTTIIGIENGESSTGVKWTKFSDGTMIQYGRFVVSFNNEAFIQGTVALPYAFVGLPATSVGPASTGNSTLIFRCSGSVAQDNNQLDWSIGTYNNAAISSANRSLDFIIIGRWK